MGMLLVGPLERSRKIRILSVVQCHGVNSIGLGRVEVAEERHR